MMIVQSRFDSKKIGELVCDGALKYVQNFAVEIDGDRVAEYKSLDKVASEWEDYVPQEPLLKDYPNEMNAIRAYGCSPLRFHRHARKGYSTFNFCSHYICFDGIFENLEDGKSYTIDELCGKDEE